MKPRIPLQSTPNSRSHLQQQSKDGSRNYLWLGGFWLQALGQGNFWGAYPMELKQSFHDHWRSVASSLHFLLMPGRNNKGRIFSRYRPQVGDKSSQYFVYSCFSFKFTCRFLEAQWHQRLLKRGRWLYFKKFQLTSGIQSEARNTQIRFSISCFIYIQFSP